MATPQFDEIEFHFFSAPPTHSPPFGSPQLGFSEHSPPSPSTSPSSPPKSASPPRHRHQKRSTPSPFSSPLASTSSLPLPKLLGVPAEAVGTAPTSTAPSSSSRSRSRTPSVSRTIPQIGPLEPLIADVQLRKTRLVIRKTCTIYDSLLVPFRSVLVGFNVAFHTPPSSTARVKDCQLQLVFHGPEGLPSPVIKALAPSTWVGSTTLGLPLTVTYDKGITGSVKLGYDPYASAQLTATSGKKYTADESAKLVASGIETQKALITVAEDSSSTVVVPPSFEFAVLIHIPEHPGGVPASGVHPSSFEIELSVEASLARGAVQETWARFLGSPREWRLRYDGTTGLGVLQLAANAMSTQSGQVILPSV